MTSPLFLGHLVGMSLELMQPGRQRDTTFTKIFVGGLPYHSDHASLRKYFQSFGDVDEAVVVTDKQTGKSRGYGFVSPLVLCVCVDEVRDQTGVGVHLSLVLGFCCLFCILPHFFVKVFWYLQYMKYTHILTPITGSCIIVQSRDHRIIFVSPGPEVNNDRRVVKLA